MPATKRKETDKNRIRRTRRGGGEATLEAIFCALQPVMIADGDRYGLFDHPLGFDRYRGRLFPVGAARPVFIRLDAVGTARGGRTAFGGLRNCPLYPYRPVCDR